MRDWLTIMSLVAGACLVSGLALMRSPLGRGIVLGTVVAVLLATTMLRTTPDNEVAIACYRANGFVRLTPQEETAWNVGQRREWVWMVLGRS
jgi:hypothetical protein